MPIVMACLNMSKGKVGALIVIEKNFPLDDIARTGDIIDANINQRLIENIFFQKQSATRWSYDYQQQTYKGCRMYSSGIT